MDGLAEGWGQMALLHSRRLSMVTLTAMESRISLTQITTTTKLQTVPILTTITTASSTWSTLMMITMVFLTYVLTLISMAITKAIMTTVCSTESHSLSTFLHLLVAKITSLQTASPLQQSTVWGSQSTLPLTEMEKS